MDTQHARGMDIHMYIQTYNMHTHTHSRVSIFIGKDGKVSLSHLQQRILFLRWHALPSSPLHPPLRALPCLLLLPPCRGGRGLVC